MKDEDVEAVAGKHHEQNENRVGPNLRAAARSKPRLVHQTAKTMSRGERVYNLLILCLLESCAVRTLFGTNEPVHSSRLRDRQT